MLKEYSVPINEDNKLYYRHMKGHLSSMSMSLLGAMTYSLVAREVSPNAPPDWFIVLLGIVLILWLVKKSFARSPTIVFIKPSKFRYKTILAKLFNYATLLFIGVTCSALYPVMTSSAKNTPETYIPLIISYGIFNVAMFFCSYFSIDYVTEIERHDR